MALGIIETRGLNAAAEAVDTMCKTAQVDVKKIVRSGGGHITILAQGEVAAVQAAVEAGFDAASFVGADIICHAVIPNPHKELIQYLAKEVLVR